MVFLLQLAGKLVIIIHEMFVLKLFPGPNEFPPDWTVRLQQNRMN